jgi:hypothetical protein
MDPPTTESGIMPEEAATSSGLDREGVRAHVAAHLAAHRPVEELGIERNRPLDCRDFAFVGIAPKRTGPRSRYRCSFCQTEQKFGSGRIVLSSDGLLRLIGDDCWERHLDKDRYDKEAQDYRDYQTRQRFERLRDHLHPAIRDAAKRIRTLIIGSGEAVGFVEELPSLLKRHAPQLFEQLQEASRANGQLRVERSARDYAAMERAGAERFTTRLETRHFVSGLQAALGPAHDLQEGLRAAVRDLNTAMHAIDTTAWGTLANAAAAKQIKAIETHVHSALQLTSQVSTAVQQVSDFLATENVVGMSRWCSDHDCELQLDNATLTATVRGFCFECDSAPPFEVERPQSLTRDLVPDLSALKQLLAVA